MFARCASPSPLRRASSRPLLISAAIHSSAGFWELAGSSSVPISKTRSISGHLDQVGVARELLVRQRAILEAGELHPCAGGEIELRAVVRELAHAQDVPLALGDADRAARVEQIEGVRAFQAVVVGGQRKLAPDQCPALLLVLVEQPEQAFGIAGMEAVLALLPLVLPEHVAVG